MTGSKSLHVRPGRLAISRTLESRAPLERGRRQKTIVCPTLRPRLSSLLLCALAHIANRLALSKVGRRWNEADDRKRSSVPRCGHDFHPYSCAPRRTSRTGWQLLATRPTQSLGVQG